MPARVWIAGRVAAGLLGLAALVSAMGVHAADDQALSELPAATRELLLGAQQRLVQPDAAAQRSANALMREGDHAYRAGDYDAARRAYANAYPNWPLPRAYVMAGDAHWRSVLKFRKTAATDPSGCQLNNEHFAHDLSQSLDQQHLLGLALARTGKASARLSPRLHGRAQRSAQCLRQLATDHQSLPAFACVNLDRLQACLGTPLPVPGR